jgi:hypothetical protein
MSDKLRAAEKFQVPGKTLDIVRELIVRDI